MSRVIHKFLLEPPFGPKLDPNAKLLHVEGIGADLFLWAEVDPDATKQELPLRFAVTGGDVPEDCEYVGTGRVYEDPLTPSIVIHVYRPLLTFSDLVQGMFPDLDARVAVPDAYI